MGWEVWIAALVMGHPMASEFAKHDFRIVDLLSQPPLIGDARFDLVWVHHAPVFYELFMVQKIESSRVIFCSHSHFEPLEAVPAYMKACDRLIANSVENRDHIIRELGLDEGQVVVFPNAAPSNYWGLVKEDHGTVLKRVAIISNHPPPEILEATVLLEKAGVNVTHVGAGGTQILMSPELLLNFDVVITIGKTIPYCFALKVSVYCYDHFGGPGWLNEDNLQLASRNNFSGRGFSKKTAITIFKQIVEGYRESLGELDGHRRHADQYLNMRRNLERLLSSSSAPVSGQMSLTGTRQEQLLHAQYMRLVRVLRSREVEIGGLERELLRVKSTVSWRLTSPFRAIYNLLRRVIDVR